MEALQKMAAETKIAIDKFVLESYLATSNAELVFLESGDSDAFVDSIKRAIKEIFDKIKTAIEDFSKKLMSAAIQTKFEVVVKKLKEENKKIELDSDYSSMIDEYKREINDICIYLAFLHVKIPTMNELEDCISQHEEKVEKFRNTKKEVSTSVILNDVKSVNSYIRLVDDTWQTTYKELTRDIEKMYRYDFNSDRESISEKKRIHMYIVRKSSTLLSKIMSVISKYYSDIISKCK